MQIKEIFQQAKEHFLELGVHRPALYVELAQKGIILIIFADFPYKTTLEKQKVLFGFGRKCAKECPGDELRQVAFVVEAWTSNDPHCKVPSEDPNRKEALGVWVLSIDEDKSVDQTGYVAEIIRSGNSIDLLDYSEVKVGYNKILLAFLGGFASGNLSDAELAKHIEAYAKGKRTL